MDATNPNVSKCLAPQSKIDRLLKRYSAVFEEPSILPPSRPEDHQIKFENDSKMPPWRPLGRLSTYELETLKEMLTKLLDIALSHTAILLLVLVSYSQKK
jgi:hypothetical protein